VDDAVAALEPVGPGDLVVAGQWADLQVAVGLGDAVQPGQAIHVHEDGGGREAELQQRDEALTAGQDLGVVTVLGQDLEGLVEGFGRDIVERTGVHASSGIVAGWNVGAILEFTTECVNARLPVLRRP
jgi:hypothetical protein